MKGIDISKHNGTIDFNKVKNDNVEVIIIKATEGVNFIDCNLETNYKGASGKGMHIGFYHFMSETSDPTEQASDFWDAIKNKNFDVLPVLDIETNTKNRSAKEITDRCLKFLDKFKKLSGMNCVIYTGGYFGRDCLDSRIKSYKAWIAHYGVSKPMATGFSNVVGHQYSESGKVSGISGNVDMDTFTNGILRDGSNINDNKNDLSKLYNYEQHGSATVLVNSLSVRTFPSVNGPKVTSYSKGHVIKNYDRVYENDGYRWIRFKENGSYRYVAVRVLKTNEKYANCY